MRMQSAPLEPSLWFATAKEAPATFSLEERVETSVCVIGGGYTGLSTALHLGERGVDTVVLEAARIGQGGSGRNAGHCTPTFTHYGLPDLRRMLGERLGEVTVAVLNFPAALAHLAVELIAKDGEKPCLHVGAHLEMVLFGPGLHDGVLNQIVSAIMPADQRHGKGTQTWKGCEHFTLETGFLRRHSGAQSAISGIDWRSTASSFSSRSRKRSGIASS